MATFYVKVIDNRTYIVTVEAESVDEARDIVEWSEWSKLVSKLDGDHCKWFIDDIWPLCDCREV